DVRVVTRHETSDDLGVQGVDAISAPNLGEAIDVLTAAKAVIGIDTGLTHLAAQQGTPTVMICRARCVYFRAWPHTRPVRGTECADACVRIEREYAYNARVELSDFEWRPRVCPVASQCLAGVQAHDVIGALEELL